MTYKKSCSRCPRCRSSSLPSSIAGQGRGLPPSELLKPLVRLVADVLRGLHRPALQRADEHQPSHGQEPVAGVGVERDARIRRWRRRARGSRRRRRWRQRHRGRARDDRLPAGRRLRHQGHAADGGRHALRVHARQRLGDRRARRPRDLALLLENARRHPHRQSRPRHLERLPLHGDARQLSRVARREDGQASAGTRRSPTSTSSTSRRPRRSSSTTTSSSARATTSIRQVSCSRSTRRPAISNGSSIRCR